MRNFTETTVSATRHYCAASMSSQIKKLVLGIMLVVSGAALPASTFAANISNVSNINRAAAMEKQRNINKANLARVRHFDRKSKDARSLKLDALPQSPRRGAYHASISMRHKVSAKSQAIRD